MDWHVLDISAACSHLQVDPACGLDSGEASRRLLEQGKNELTDSGGVSPWRILGEQCTSIMALILTAASVVSFVIGSFKDAISILAIVCLFAILGFVQEYRAERAMRALKRLAVPSVRARRDSAVFEVLSNNLVAGDVVLLEAGNVVPADCRLLETYALKIQESMLTGETDAVEKQSTSLHEITAQIAHRSNMAWMGTIVTGGRATALVVATGMRTELGRIAGMIQEVQKTLTPLQKRLDRLGKLLASVAVVIAGFVFGLGVWRGEAVRDMLMIAVSLAVAAIPEGLPAVVTITLAIASQRMLGRRALIRKLPAVETLGSVTVICTDKTGTLTENRMTVTALVSAETLEGTAGENDCALLRLAAVLCNDASLRIVDGNETPVGDPTEGALLLEAAVHGMYRSELEAAFPRVAEIAFNSVTKRMLTVHVVADGVGQYPRLLGADFEAGDRLICAKGASDSILAICSADDSLRAAVSHRVDLLAAQGQRVLAFAYRRVCSAELVELDACQKELRLLGLIAMMDPPRAKAKDAVSSV